MRVFAIVLTLAQFSALIRADEKRVEPKVYQVPYRLTNTSHVLIRAKINGKGPYNLILDTGAPALFVSTAVCRKLNIPADKNGWGTFDRFEIEGGIVLKKCRGRIEDPFQLEGMNGLGLAGVEIHGIIGYTILARYRLGFDFTKEKMTWEPLHFDPPPPQGLNERSVAGGMEALGSVMKIVGAFLGKKNDPEAVPRGFLGVLLEESNGKIQIRTVLPKGPAAEAGLMPGDEIVRFQGNAPRSIADLQKHFAEVGIAGTVEVQVLRGDSTKSVRINSGKGL
jgi:hypothetical protein